MPEIANVVLSETIVVAWGNNIRDRTAQRYDDLTTRGTENPTPVVGDLAFMQDTGDLDFFFGGAWRHIGSPVGTIIDHGGGSVPIGWLVCDGAAVSRTTYARLFAQIGVAWGVGDGSTTFNVPDLRGRVTRGVAVSGVGAVVGEVFGADDHVHSGPSHAHTNPSTSTVGDHAHGVGNTGGAGDHLHTNPDTGAPNENVAFGPGSGFEAASNNHRHAQGFTNFTGGHVHTNPNTSTTGNHSHTQGNTGAGGTSNTGSASTIQAGAAVNKLIRT